MPVDELFKSRQDTVDIDSHVENILRKLKVAFGKVKDNTDKAAQEMVQRQEDVCRETRYTPGQNIWLMDHTAQAGGKRKLGMRYKGPGKVIRQEGPMDSSVVYRVRMPDGKEVKVHHNHLKPVRERQPDQEPPCVEDTDVSEQSEGDEPSLDQEECENPVEQEETEGNADISNFIWILDSGQRPEQANVEEPNYVTRYGRMVKPVRKYQA